MKRDNKIELKRISQFLIDSTALKSDKGSARENIMCKVERFKRGIDRTIKY